MSGRKSRKHEKLKPRPHPKNAIILTKELVATTQLETAIDLWFGEVDPISTLMLAFNAHEILHALAKRIGKPSPLEVWLDTLPDSVRERVRAMTRYVWNFCKHGGKDIDDKTPHDPRCDQLYIFFAGRCYRAVYGTPTPLMVAFDLRLIIEDPDLAAIAAREPLSQLLDVYHAGQISRQQFLHEYLPLIETAIAEGRLHDILEKP
jgi:hypothetical protein